MTPCILMRPSLAEEEEQQVASTYFPLYTQRSLIPSNSLVIGRYSTYPWYVELENDLKYNGSALINTWNQHQYIADLRNWYEDLDEYTFRTWHSLYAFKQSVPDSDPRSFVLKGVTNSKKGQWKTHMFARSATDVSEVWRKLTQDGLLQDQDIIIREYVELRSFGEGVGGLPITEEYRFFVLDRQIVGGGFYWSQFPEVREAHNLNVSNVPQDFLQDIISDVWNNARFYVIDVARTTYGDWVLVELNDGQQSGLSEVNANELYSNMARVLRG